MEKIGKFSALTVGAQSTTLPETYIGKRCSEKNAAAGVGLLMGAFPDLGKIDPDVFARALQSLFMSYPEDVVERTVKTLPWSAKWLPTLAEVKEFLDNGGHKPRPPEPPRYVTPDTTYKGPPSTKKARPETVASWDKWAAKHKVDHLPEEHPDRREQLIKWGKEFVAGNV